VISAFGIDHGDISKADKLMSTVLRYGHAQGQRTSTQEFFRGSNKKSYGRKTKAQRFFRGRLYAADKGEDFVTPRMPRRFED
jgi:hypothetical protein